MTGNWTSCVICLFSVPQSVSSLRHLGDNKYVVKYDLFVINAGIFFTTYWELLRINEPLLMIMFISTCTRDTKNVSNAHYRH